jgi:hypothetical protein
MTHQGRRKIRPSSQPSPRRGEGAKSKSPLQVSHLATTQKKCAAPNNTPTRPVQTHTSGPNPSQNQGPDAGNRMSHRFRVARPTSRPRTDALQGLIGFGRNLFQAAVGAGRDDERERNMTIRKASEQPLISFRPAPLPVPQRPAPLQETACRAP